MNFVRERRKLLSELETAAGVVPSRSVVEIEAMEGAEEEDEEEERERWWFGWGCWRGRFWGFRATGCSFCMNGGE